MGTTSENPGNTKAGKETDVMFDLLDGFVNNTTTTTTTTTTTMPAKQPAGGVGTGSMAPMGGNTANPFGNDAAFDFLNPFPANTNTGPPVLAQGASGTPPKPPVERGAGQFNPIEDEANPFVDDVLFPVTKEGLELERKIESAEVIPGFDEFVSEQLKQVNIEPPAAPAPAPVVADKRKERKSLVTSTPSLVPKIAADVAARAAPTELPPPPAYDDVVQAALPPAYDDVAKESSPPTAGRGRSGSTKADLQYLWPMPFVKARLKPMQRDQAASLQLLAGSDTTLVSAPNKYGSLRVWQNADTSLDMTTAELQRYNSYLVREDGDSSPAIDIPNRVEGKITCITVDNKSNRIWAGHATGEVTYWDSVSLKFLHMFQAHRNGSVNAIIVTAYGDVWTGSSRGSLRIWKDGGKVLPRSGQNSFELRRSNGDRAHGRIKALLYVPAANVVWSCGIHSLALWNATTGAYISSVGELEKRVLNDLENSYDEIWSGSGSVRSPSLQRKSSMASDAGSDFSYGDGWASGSDLGSASSRYDYKGTKKATQQLGSITSKASYLLGKGLKLGKKAVAKSVDKVYNATSGMAPEEGATPGQTLATILDARNNVWVVYNNRIVELYSKNGKIVKTWEEPQAITCICTVGKYVWAGLTNGQIKVWDSSYDVSALWKGHHNAVVSITAVSSRIYTLSADGCVSGWHYKCPIEWNEKYASWILNQASKFVNTVQVTVFAGTWNVNQMDLAGIRSALPRWVESGAKNADIAILGLQEVEMGARTVAESIVKETFAKSMQEKGNLAAQTWFQEMLGALCRTTNNQWHRVGTRQLSGILLGVYVRDHLKTAVGEVDTCSVARGVMGVGGNKGTVAVSLSIYRRKFLFLCSHFAAHQNAVAKRNEDYMAAARELKLSNGEDQEDIGGSYQESPLLRDTDLMIWVGDFNYRVEMPYAQACEASYNGDFKSLQSCDQCLKEMSKGNTFVGFKEGVLNFPPTYKFDKRTSTYDTSEKQRIPAWCDRVLYRAKSDPRQVLPGYGNLGPKYVKGFPSEPVTCCLQTYSSCHNIVESDHKPVYAVMNLGLRSVDEGCHRQLSVQAMKNLDSEKPAAGDLGVEFDESPPKDSQTGGFTIINNGDHDVVYEILNEDERSGAFLPNLVLLLPNGGLLEPKTSGAIAVGVNSDPSLSENIHRLESICLRVNYWVYGRRSTTAKSKVITTQMSYERYFHSI
ncbi:inositol polyphosphate phosphatase [Chloropicon primus]|nr:inositol polyphosphate phosphatase [Chloropicon primus]